MWGERGQWSARQPTQQPDQRPPLGCFVCCSPLKERLVSYMKPQILNNKMQRSTVVLLLAAPTGGGPIRKPYSQPGGDKTSTLRSGVLSLERRCVAQVISLPLSFGEILSFFIVHFTSPCCAFTRGVGSSLGCAHLEGPLPCTSSPPGKWLGCRGSM